MISARTSDSVIVPMIMVPSVFSLLSAAMDVIPYAQQQREHGGPCRRHFALEQARFRPRTGKPSIGIFYKEDGQKPLNHDKCRPLHPVEIAGKAIGGGKDKALDAGRFQKFCRGIMILTLC